MSSAHAYGFLSEYSVLLDFSKKRCVNAAESGLDASKESELMRSWSPKTLSNLDAIQFTSGQHRLILFKSYYKCNEHKDYVLRINSSYVPSHQYTPQHDWHCLCYEERYPSDYGTWRTSTSCRRGRSECGKLKTRILFSVNNPYHRHANKNVRLASSAPVCKRLGFAAHPADLRGGTSRKNWIRSDKNRGFWTPTGCWR